MVRPGHFSIDTNQVDGNFQFTGGPLTSGYESAEIQNMQGHRVTLANEDHVLKQRGRDRVDSAQLTLQRQTTIAGWCVRKNADFVATHNFDCLSEHAGLDEDVEGLVDEWSEKEEFDLRGRLGLQDHIRLDENQRVFRGDMLIHKHASGKVQAIEADRIRNPDEKTHGRNWVNGTLANAHGRITHFAIHRRDGHRFKFERVLEARKVYHFGYYKRHDQYRGISEMSSAITHLRQIHNAIKYAQAKQVISQIFGMKVKKNKPTTRDIDLTGTFIAEVGLDEDIEFMADNTPSTEFDNFLRHVISIVMKSLDLPYNFYDEAHTNFFGSRAALNLYLMSCLAKRRGVRELLNHLTLWRLNFEVSRGRLRLPRSIDLKKYYRKHCEWIPVGVQWFNPQQEAKAAETLLKLRLTSRSEIRKQTHGDSWFSLADRIEREEIRLANSTMPFDDEHSGGNFDADGMVAMITESVTNRLIEMGVAA